MSNPSSPARREIKLLEDTRNQESNITKRAMVRFREARGKGAMAFGMQGTLQEDVEEGSLRREILDTWGLHNAAESVGGM